MKILRSSSRGQLVVLLLLLLPVGLTLLVALADVAAVVVTKARLQAVADRAVFAAGGVLTPLMNDLMRLNGKIHDEFAAQEREFRVSQQQSAAGGESKLQQRQMVIDQLRSEMHSLVNHGYAEACTAALRVATAETPDAEMLPLYGGARVVTDDAGPTCLADTPLFSFYGDWARDDQWRALEFTYPSEGVDWQDPGDVDDGRDELLRYRTKVAGPDQQVAFALRLRAPLPRGLARELFTGTLTGTDARPDDVGLSASAAAQPIGGSIEAAAFLEADDGISVEERMEAEGLFYETTLVPLDRLQQRELGYQGLRYFHDTEGWVEDEDWYLQ